jgi:hypothetical protein
MPSLGTWWLQDTVLCLRRPTRISWLLVADKQKIHTSKMEKLYPLKLRKNVIFSLNNCPILCSSTYALLLYPHLLKGYHLPSPYFSKLGIIIHSIIRINHRKTSQQHTLEWQEYLFTFSWKSKWWASNVWYWVRCRIICQRNRKHFMNSIRKIYVILFYIYIVHDSLWLVPHEHSLSHYCWI